MKFGNKDIDNNLEFIVKIKLVMIGIILFLIFYVVIIFLIMCIYFVERY